MSKSRMYDGVETWNPCRGCKFGCTYCGPSFKKLAKMVKGPCDDCRSFEPHCHPERLLKVPKGGDMLFVCSSGDISFCPPDFFRRIMDAVADDERTVLLQSKDPSYFKQFLNELPLNVMLGTTLETNRDEGYGEISSAPVPSVRWRDFMDLHCPRKAVTVEPIMDFDLCVFTGIIIDIAPEIVWVGYNSTPHAAPLPEPSEAKIALFIRGLRRIGIQVRLKEMRGLEI